MYNVENENSILQDLALVEPLDTLSEPFKLLIDTAMNRVRKGQVDPEGMQTVYLNLGHRFYRIFDTHVKQEGFLGKTVRSEGDLGSGLFVEAIADEQGGFHFVAELPRNSEEKISQEKLDKLERLNPSEVHDIAKQIKEAKKTRRANWEKVLELPWY
jgi:hypothetical protein